MPAGNQSLVPWTPTVYTAMVASAYKADIDANSSIAGNPGGSFYVYPGSGMTLNVDAQGYTFRQAGQSNPFVIAGNVSQSTIVLTAPGSNSYYACVY